MFSKCRSALRCALMSDVVRVLGGGGVATGNTFGTFFLRSVGSGKSVGAFWVLDDVGEILYADALSVLLAGASQIEGGRSTHLVRTVNNRPVLLGEAKEIN